MDFQYVSAKEAASQIGVTERWIQQLCKDGRVEGAMLFGAQGVWLIPKEWVEKKSQPSFER